MKILYGIQATGNGHIARAKEVIPELKKYADVDVLLSGPGAGMDLEQPVKFRMKGFGFTYSSGKIEILKSIRSMDINRLIRDIYKFDMSPYDLVVSDFEPISLWAANIKGVKSVGIANQYSFANKKVRKEMPLSPILDLTINVFALCDKKIALNYTSYDKNMFTPIIRKEIRELQTSEQGHITVYLWDDVNEIALNVFKKFKNLEWHIFSNKNKVNKKVGNIIFQKIDNYEFAKSLASCSGTITGAGFAATTEALYLGKKILTLPLKHNPEQENNARQLEKMGVKVVKEVNNDFDKEIADWLENYYPVHIDYPDVTPKIVKTIIDYAHSNSKNKD